MYDDAWDDIKTCLDYYSNLLERAREERNKYRQTLAEIQILCENCKCSNPILQEKVLEKCREVNCIKLPHIESDN